MAWSNPSVISAKVPRRTSLGSTMSEIRTWLDREQIQPAAFKTVVSRAGLGFEIEFNDERAAQRFQEQFPSLVEKDQGAPRRFSA
jgi:hypothetical protein